ncbi:hypothetical protein OS493_018309 [Desmophyllum pertusum]|uniref:Endonuclease/exonuclease/phosphatase domain-containing protein n=1 Tax=Desmophyllum pertusum TaxID=174260 RepID=A0A9X0CEU4_9CNID|nr:hypothetical protein OS493_018309 [Desmophyllum pertusum]
MEDPTIYLKSLEGVDTVDEKKEEGIINEVKKDIQEARLKSATIPSYFIMTINMHGKAKRDDRVLLLMNIMSTYFSSIIFCQEIPGHFVKDIVDKCGTLGYDHVKTSNYEAAVLWRTEDFVGSTVGLKLTDRSIIKIRERVKLEHKSECLPQRFAMVQLTRCNSSESVLAVSWHGPLKGFRKVERPIAFNGLTTFLKEVCKENKIPSFVIGGDFNLNTLDDSPDGLKLGEDVAVSSYELSPRQKQRSTASNYIPHKDNFVFLKGNTLKVSWTRPFEIEDPRKATASDLTEGGHTNVQSEMASGRVEDALDHDPIIGVLELLSAKTEQPGDHEEIMSSSLSGNATSQTFCSL